MRSDYFTPRKALCIAALGLVTSGFALGVALAGGKVGTDDLYVEAYNQTNLIRFHVIANSDSLEDQALKRRVRDLIVQYMTPKFELAQNVNEARNITVDNLLVMEQIAKAEAARWGKNYGAKAVLGRFTFPEKSYGSLTLPKGEYEAVRIVLGEGNGANWWCVLFPPLCFLSGSKEMPAESLPAEMSVNPELLTDLGTNNIPETEIRVKFKIVELLEKGLRKAEATK